MSISAFRCGAVRGPALPSPHAAETFLGNPVLLLNFPLGSLVWSFSALMRGQVVVYKCPRAASRTRSTPLAKRDYVRISLFESHNFSAMP